MLALAASGAAADDSAERLERLRARIDTLQRELNQTRERRDSAREQVDAAERRVDSLVRSLRDIDAHVGQYTRSHAELKTRAERERAALRAHTQTLGTQVRAQYAMGSQPYLKLLLNQESPAATARVLAYYRYFHEARVKRINQLRTALERLQQLDEQLLRSTRALTQLRESRERERIALEQTRTRRAELLASLDRELTDRTQEIGRLKADEQRLERLVAELKTALAEPTLVLPGPTERFGALKGRLPLPYPGRIQARFGEPKGVGALRWRGLFLSGREGQEIHAVSRGRVAYADWLRGFGLLLILDHGDGYMTLYGHNQALYRRVGDWVEAGQPIATVGNTGDAPGTGLYFEIRHNGIPHDPLQWCAVGQNAKPKGSARSRR